MDKENSMLQDLEGLLKSDSTLLENETIYDYLRKPYSEIEKVIHKYDQIYSENDFRLLMIFSMKLMYLFQIKNTTLDNKVLFNINKARKEISLKFVDALHPRILTFFKWDLDRRMWAEHENDYQIIYIKKTIEEISNEVAGNSDQLLDKYLPILFDYFFDFFEEALAQPENLAFFEKNKSFNEDDFFKNINMFNALRENLSEIIENHSREYLRVLYSSIATPYLKGMLNVTGEFNFLILAFIKAQIEYKNLLTNQLSVLEKNTTEDFIRLKSYIEELKLTLFVQELKSIFASIPNVLIKNSNEAYYHMFIHIILKIIGCNYESEINTNIGRIDGVLETKDNIFIIEFKIGSAKTAIEQIIEKKYYESYINRNKKINLLGISFCKKEYNINDFDYILDYTNQENKNHYE